MRSVLSIMFLIMLFSTAINAQKKTFMRFYNQKGKIFERGIYNSVTDSSVFILKNSKKVEIPINKIDLIKLRLGAGHLSRMGALIGGVTLGLYFAAQGDSNGEALSGPGAGFIIGLLAGGTGGALAGGIVGTFVKGDSFAINGNSTTWQEQKNLIAQLPSTNQSIGK